MFNLQGDIILQDRATGTINDVRRGVDRLEREFQDFNRTAQQAGGLLGGGGLLAGGVGGILAGVSAREVVQVAAGMEQLAREAENSERALVALAGGASEARARIEAVRDASGGAVSRLEAMQIASRTAATGLATSADELERITTLVNKIAQISGQSTDFVISNLQLDVLNKTGIRLDQILLGADEVDAKFEELSETMDDLNAARLEAILQVGEAQFADVDVQVSAVQELTAAWEDYRLTLSGASSEATTTFFSGLAGEVRELDIATQIMDLWFRANLRGEEAVQEHKAAINELARALVFARPEELADELNALQTELDETTVAAEETSEAIIELDENIRALSVLAGRVDLGDLTPDERQILGAPDPMFADPGTGPSIGDVNAERREDERRAQERIAREAEQEWRRAARETEAAFERAAREAESAFQSAVGKVPGVLGTSEVTQEQLDQAAAGVPQNFADDYLRQLTDEVINGVDWENVDIRDAAQRAGIDPNLPAEIILQMFSDAWEGGRLFAGGENLDLFNLDAVAAEFEKQAQDEAGSEAVIQMLRDRFGGQFGIDQFLPDADTTELTAGIDVPAALEQSLGQQDLGSPMISALQDSWAGDDFLARVGNIGVRWAQATLGGAVTYVEDGPPELDALAAVLLGQLMAAITEGG